MFGLKSSGDDPRPRSAVSHGVGVAGLIGLACWILIARQYGMDGPYSALAACAACAIPMVLWSLLMDKVHLRSSTGIDWQNPERLKDTFDISLVKLTGLWATWGLIATIYCVGRWYWTGQYQFSMELLGAVAPWLFVLSIPYVLIMDRFTIEPRDGAWHFGQLLTGGKGEFNREQIYHHLRAWAVKGFFLAFMISIVPGGFGDLVRLDLADINGNPVAIARWLIVAMFVIDVQFATVGYLLTMKPLDAHIRTANPYLAGWVAALMCYPPFILMGDNGPLNYHVSTADWAYWFDGRPAILWVCTQYGADGVGKRRLLLARQDRGKTSAQRSGLQGLRGMDGSQRSDSATAQPGEAADRLVDPGPRARAGHPACRIELSKPA